MTVVAAPIELLACHACGHLDVDITQVCGACSRSLCSWCWGPDWLGLACQRCRAQARWRHPAGRHLRVVR